VRRATPDSEAVASSEDERPWPSRTSFGSLPRKENSVPGLPGGIWAAQRRDSLKLSEAAHRNAAREVRLGASNPHSGLRTASTPSPSTSDGTNHGQLPFAIPLQPTPKAHRSLSHSQGQREMPPHTAATLGGGSGASALPLDLLVEEHDDDTDSDHSGGGQLSQTLSHPPMNNLQRAFTFSNTFGDHGYTNGRNGSSVDFGFGRDQRLEPPIAGLTLGQ
jgi:hypothetical protein